MGELLDFSGPPKCAVCGQDVAREPKLELRTVLGYESRYDGHELRLVLCEEHTDEFIDLLVNRYGEGILKRTKYVTE